MKVEVVIGFSEEMMMIQVKWEHTILITNIWSI